MADWFDPAEYEPHGVVCAACRAPLTRANAMRVDVTDAPDTPPWERTPEDEPRVYLLKCVDCVVNNVEGES